MKKKLLYFLCYILCNLFCNFSGYFCYAQDSKMVQWKQGLADAETQENVAKIVEFSQNLAAFYLQQNDSKTALNYALQALKSAESLTNKVGNTEKVGGEKVAELQVLLAKIYRKEQAYNKSIEYLQKAQTFYQTQKDAASIQKELAKEMAEVYGLQKQYANAEKSYNYLYQLARQSNDTKSEVLALTNLVSLCSAQKNYVAALDYAQKLAANYEKTTPEVGNNKKTENLAFAYQNIGYLFRQQNDLKNSELYFKKSIAEFEKLNQENTTTLNNLAVTYSMLGNFAASEQYYRKAIALSSKNNKVEDLANAYNFSAANELLRKKSFDAIDLANQAIEIAKPANAYAILADSYLILNDAYTQQGDFKAAQEAFKKSEEYQKIIEKQVEKQKEDTQKLQTEAQQTENNLLLSMADKEKQALNLKQIVLESQKKEQTLQLLQQEKNLQEVKLKNQQLDKETAEQQLKIAKQLLETTQKSQEIKNLEQQKQVQQLEIDKKQAQQEEQKKVLELEKNKNQLLETDKKLQNLELQEGKTREQFAYWAILGAIFILAIMAFAAWRNNQQNKLLRIQQKEIAIKNSELQASEEELRQNSDMLAAMNSELSGTLGQVQSQKHIIEKKNEDIIASINYALRIQKAILPTISQIKAVFPESFVFYKPRDIVSGDFYWFTELPEKTILVAADCTGHGVSGAFMTMIGNNILNQIIVEQNITEPDEILNQVPILLNKILSSSEGKVKDGMDLAILSVAKTSKTKLQTSKSTHTQVSYAGAMIPLYYIENQEFKEIKADKMPIGSSTDENFIYAKHELLVQNATSFYLASDGYQDQFGGEANRRFMKRQVRDLLLNIHQKPMAEQQNIVENTIITWKEVGKEAQTDDMMMLGIQVG
jgi:tetratricopeptide (TPR) repeat protein